MEYLKKICANLLIVLAVLGCNHDEKEFIKPVPLAMEATGVVSTAFKASWKPVLGASEYILEVATNDLFGDQMLNGFPLGVEDTSFTVNNLEAGQWYYYRIRASKYNGPSDYSNTVRVQTKALSAPVALDAADVRTNSFKAQWKPVAEATSYLLFVATDVNFTELLEGYEGKDITDTVYTVRNLIVNRQYYYKVQAKRGNALSDYSYIIHTPTSDLATPVGMAATEISHTGFTIRWNAVAGASSYLVYISEDPLLLSPLPDYAPKENNTNILTVEGLHAGTTYYYRIQAVNQHSISGKSETAFMTTTAIEAPVASEAGDIQINSLVAQWQAAAYADHYLLDVSLDADFNSYLPGYKAKEVQDTSLLVAGLSKGTAYYYRVRSQGLGATSAYSQTVSATTRAFASPVALNAVDIHTSGFTAVWKGVAGADKYLLDVATDANFDAILSAYHELPVSDTAALVTDLLLNKTYYYRVVAVKGSDRAAWIRSGYSNIISQTTTSLVKPVLIAASGIGLTGFTANWQTVGGATGYSVDIAKDALFTDLVSGYQAKAVQGNAITVSNLDANRQYYVRVRAVNGAAVSEYSAVGLVKTAAIDAPVALNAGSITYEGFRANWLASTHAESYVLDVALDADFKNYVPGFNAKVIAATTDIITGLEPAQQYYYRVRSQGLNSFSANSATISLTTGPLPTPVAEAASYRKADGFTASWQEAAGAASYLLYVAGDADFTQMVEGFNGKEVIGNSWEVSHLSPYKTYYYRVRSKRLSALSAYSAVVVVDACISGNCRVARREFAGEYTENYSYEANNLPYLIQLRNAGTAQLVKETTLTYMNGYISEAIIRKADGADMVLFEKWFYTFNNGKVSEIKQYNASAELQTYLKFGYHTSGLLAELQVYADLAATILLRKEVYVYNTNGQIVAVKNGEGEIIKKFVHSSGFSVESMLPSGIQLLLYDPSGGIQQAFAGSNGLANYQYFDGGSNSWKSFSYTYLYNQKGIPEKVLGGSSVPDLVYEFEHCSF